LWLTASRLPKTQSVRHSRPPEADKLQRESRKTRQDWIPAFAGMTVKTAKPVFRQLGSKKQKIQENQGL
jgi:hypothetical protein